jgi:Cof subfamily protein (haloacid dehalogenase superfamily)
LDKLELDGFHVFCDGALVCNSKQDQEIYVKPILPDVLERACANASRHDLSIELYSASTLFIDHETWITDIQRKFFGIDPKLVNFSSIFSTERIVKGGLAVSSSEEESRAKAFSSKFKDELYFSWARTPAYPQTNFINITSAGVSKGKALEALTAYLGLKLDEVMAVGDGHNDISLLSTAGFSIAMQNAPDELKVVADHITANVEESGVAEAINKFLI